MMRDNTDGITMTSDLSAAWKRQAAARQIRTEFVLDGPKVVEWDGVSVNLAAGDRVTVALLPAGDGVTFAVDLPDGRTVYPPTRRKDLGGGITVELHPQRALRPGADVPQTPGPWAGNTADIPAARCPFRCGGAGEPGSLLDRVPLAWVQLAHWAWVCVPNGTVFDSAHHTLWVPAAMRGLTATLPHLSQRLDAELLADLVALHHAHGGRSLTFFQPLGAGGTVNHLHYQSVNRPHALPIELAGVRRAGRFSALAGDWPARGLVFNVKPGGAAGGALLWRAVSRLQSLSCPFNLVLLRDEAYLFGRDERRVIAAEWPSGVLASAELCGRAITASKAQYDAITREAFAAALTRTTLPADEVVRMIEGS